jgi:LCP family protein required for cell wall assembly
MVLGSDRRAKTSTDARVLGPNQKRHSDTIVLIRLDSRRNRIAVLSLPRDLAVTIPGFADNRKINEAYDEGGARLTLRTVKHLFASATGKPFHVHGVIDVSFNGFQRAVNYIKGVYVDVDREYYNPEGTGYAAINIKPGYQKLVGSDALAYVRVRHTDSDLFRNARQQEFLRQAASMPAVDELKSIEDATDFANEMKQYFRFNKGFLSRRNIAGLLKTAFYLAANHAPVNQIALKGVSEAEDPEEDTRLYVSDQNLQDSYDAFMTGERTRNPKRSTKPRKVKNPVKASRTRGLENALRQGKDMAVEAAPRLKRLPFYFPEYRATGSHYTNDSPRIYSLRDDDGEVQRAYRISISTGAPGEYYGVQGLTWQDPPLLASPDLIRDHNRRTLMLYYDGRKLRRVAWRTPRAVYYVSNTLNYRLSTAKMLAIAASLRRGNS